MISEKVVSDMSDGKDKQLMELLQKDGKPYKKKFDGYAVKVEEDIEITYTDYDQRENTMKVPAGSYIMVTEDSSCPHIVTEKECLDSNKFVEEQEEKKESKPGKIGLALIQD